jgi:hypothetical protein
VKPLVAVLLAVSLVVLWAVSVVLCLEMLLVATRKSPARRRSMATTDHTLSLFRRQATTRALLMEILNVMDKLLTNRLSTLAVVAARSILAVSKTSRVDLTATSRKSRPPATAALEAMSVAKNVQSRVATSGKPRRGVKASIARASTTRRKRSTSFTIQNRAPANSAFRRRGKSHKKDSDDDDDDSDDDGDSYEKRLKKERKRREKEEKKKHKKHGSRDDDSDDADQRRSGSGEYGRRKSRSRSREQQHRRKKSKSPSPKRHSGGYGQEQGYQSQQQSSYGRQENTYGGDSYSSGGYGSRQESSGYGREESSGYGREESSGYGRQESSGYGSSQEPSGYGSRQQESYGGDSYGRQEERSDYGARDMPGGFEEETPSYGRRRNDEDEYGESRY